MEMTGGMMKAMVTSGHGGHDRISLRDVERPVPGPDEVLIRVLAAGVNNTDINTRLGWYSSEVTGDTATLAQMQERAAKAAADGGWNKASPFPLIQGTDCCGRVTAAGSADHAELIGKRVLVRPCMRIEKPEGTEHAWLGVDFNGAFAEFVKVPAREAFPVDCGWSDAELASVPCAYGTAENMLEKARVQRGETVLVTGASGGVGSAGVQLALRRGARVVAIAGRAKMEALRALGCHDVIARDDDVLARLGEESVDVVLDMVAGEGFGLLPKLLRRGGRLVSSGAIAGPIVNLDMRDVYLKDLLLIGSTAWEEATFANLIGHIERGEIKPLVAGIYPLAEMAEAQRAFMRKEHVGNFVLVP